MMRFMLRRWFWNRRKRKFDAWLASQPDIREKLDAVSRDFAESHSLTLAEAVEKLGAHGWSLGPR